MSGSFLITPAPRRTAAARSARAFTLMEVMLAMSVSAIVLAAIGGVFFTALRLRERTSALVDEAGPLYHALTTMRRDLQGVMPPSGMLAGDFKSGLMENTMAQSYGLQFYTTTGIIHNGAPWGDIQEVLYELRDPAERTATGGKDLVRSVSRNLLATLGIELDDQVLLANVQSLEVACYDGLDWRDSWDTSLGDTNLPAAVRLRVQFATESGVDTHSRQPYELIVPLITQSRTNRTDTGTTSTTTGATL